MKKLLSISLLIFLSVASIVFTACEGHNAHNVDQLVCRVAGEEDAPLRYDFFIKYEDVKGSNYGEDINSLNDIIYKSRETFINVLVNRYESNSEAKFFGPNLPNEGYTFKQILEAGATVMGWDISTYTYTKPRTMTLTYKGYTCLMYYEVV